MMSTAIVNEGATREYIMYETVRNGQFGGGKKNFN